MWAITGETLEMSESLRRRIAHFVLLAAESWVKLTEQNNPDTI